MKLRLFSNILFCGFLAIQCSGETIADDESLYDTEINFTSDTEALDIQVGAERTADYLKLLQGKRAGVVANHTSMINGSHLVDSLLKLGVAVKKVFSPEHGFRGEADAGEKVSSNVDEKSGLPIISLYGKAKKPSKDQLADLDVVIFDIQDVGARFYTYISTMHYVMEACAENKISVIIFDRPNPNGHFVDGPILDMNHTSFVGMHPVPIVHGMTVGEYAQMINGEGWLKKGAKCDLKVIKCENYSHNDFYELPIKPSPNLPNMSSVYLYPSLCLFEGTPISIGRGTATPFQVIGHPKIKSDKFSFIPESMSGAKNPKLEGEKCYGFNLGEYAEVHAKGEANVNLFWLINIYKEFPDKDGFFRAMFTLLSGGEQLQKQLEQGLSEQEIRKSWEPGLAKFKTTRKKYLLYPDFE